MRSLCYFTVFSLSLRLRSLCKFTIQLPQSQSRIFCVPVQTTLATLKRSPPALLMSRLMRNAQTQHGDYSVDEENIVLLKATLFATTAEEALPEQVTEKATEDGTTEGEQVLDPPQSPECVWFHDIEDTVEQKAELITCSHSEKLKVQIPEKRKADDCEPTMDLKKPKLDAKALKAKRTGFTNDRYYETSYYIDNGLRKVYPYYFTFTTFTKGRWVNEKILDVFAREFRAHPAKEYERCINAGTLTVNYEKVPIDYKLKHNDLLANIVHRHEVPVTCHPISIVHMDDDIVVVDKPASIPVHPCGRYRHNTAVFILAKEYNLKNLRTIHRLDRLTSGLLMFGRNPKKARQMEHQIRNRLVQKEYVCRVEGNFPDGVIECKEPIEVVSYKIGVCKVSAKGKDCTTTFEKIAYNGKTSTVLCKPLTGRMHQIRIHLQFLGYPIVNDPLYNHVVFGPLKGRGGDVGGKTDEELVRDLIEIHNAENWLGIDTEMSLFATSKDNADIADNLCLRAGPKVGVDNADSSEALSSAESPQSASELLDATTTTNEANVKIVSEPSELNVTLNTTATETNSHIKIAVATQTGHESPDIGFNIEKLTTDKHCYECKVRYRDPKPKDLVMYLHAWKYKGPEWEYQTQLPNWASADWVEPETV